MVCKGKDTVLRIIDDRRKPVIRRGLLIMGGIYQYLDQKFRERIREIEEKERKFGISWNEGVTNGKATQQRKGNTGKETH
ncbi:MAG: hypothetical protein ACP5UZ_07915 [Thermoplasmata archaeon]